MEKTNQIRSGIASLLNDRDEKIESFESPIKRSKMIFKKETNNEGENQQLPSFRDTFLSKEPRDQSINDNLHLPNAPLPPSFTSAEAPFLLPDPSAYVPYYNPLNPRFTLPSIPFAIPALQIKEKPQGDLRHSPITEHTKASADGKEETSTPQIIEVGETPTDSPTPPKAPSNGPSNLPFVFPQPHESYANGLFTLLEQPNSIQRKSYRKENRCLLPNPLIICLGESRQDVHKRAPTQVLNGTVTLRLVNADGTELPSHKSNALESVEGGLTHNLDPDNTTCFSVKALQTSEGNLFRLIFDITYTLRTGKQVEETIISKSFAVYSNKHNRNSRKTG
eukprot:TRINITY_DN19241_c0_g1_i1.p1 TRINITY_DN19241_c0_g1~~TRINITY_DN19241_c0_g1_i1.p1  ORF type:complete len:336 (-),score=50.60 TRINITY_DN19241_c0_g1_i1:146-1153(-)